jgi:hypothetical protein
MKEIDSLSVRQELDACMLTLAWNVGPVSDGDRFVATQVKVIVTPLVPDNITGSLAVHRPIAVIMTERPRVEVCVTEVLPELLGKPDRLVVS